VHELAIIEAVLDMVTDRLPDAAVSCVRLEVGELSGAVPDSLQFCFELATEGTTLQGASLEITRTPGHDLKIASVKVT
jgi:hydrogenase nickel incorporation protein HypA/HybF